MLHYTRATAAEAQAAELQNLREEHRKLEEERLSLRARLETSDKAAESARQHSAFQQQLINRFTTDRLVEKEREAAQKREEIAAAVSAENARWQMIMDKEKQDYADEQVRCSAAMAEAGSRFDAVTAEVERLNAELQEEKAEKSRALIEAAKNKGSSRARRRSSSSSRSGKRRRSRSSRSGTRRRKRRRAS